MFRNVCESVSSDCPYFRSHSNTFYDHIPDISVSTVFLIYKFYCNAFSVSPSVSLRPLSCC